MLDRYGRSLFPFRCLSRSGIDQSSRPVSHSGALILRLVGLVVVIILSSWLVDVHNLLNVGHLHEFLSEVGAPTGNNRILIFITTHLSAQHYTYLENCWPALIKKSALFKQSDFMMFITESEGEKPNMARINSVFAGVGITVHSTGNPGWQQGAILALTEAIENHWFDKYDWVVRLNPDVLIRNDSFLLERFEDSRIHGVFVDCLDQECPTGNKCTDRKIHTDFFAVRPNDISPSAVRETKQDNAERMITEAFSSIVKDGADSWVPGAGPHRANCRVSGKSSPVIHTHDYGTIHPACLSWYE